MLASPLASRIAAAADVTFNISLVSESDPVPPVPPSSFSYADVWAEGDYAYVGSDRSGQGMSIFNISDPANPQFLTMYAGSEMEDVEVHNGIGYFGSDVLPTTSGTGVDIVDLSNPASPVMLSRVNAMDCGSGGCGHNKVHTLSVSNGFLYTADNATDVVKIFNVANPSSPQFVASVDIGAPAGVASHEVVALNDRLYVASKDNNFTNCCGWTHIYDVANPAVPVLLKSFLSGPRTHTSTPTADGNTLIVTEERPNGNVHLYDISMIDQPNDPDSPVLLSTLNRANVGIDAHSPHHPHLHGNLLFITWYEAGLQVFNIADPANPVHVGAFDTYPGTSTNYNGNWGVDMSLGLNKVLISDRTRGLIIVDATDVLTAGDYNQDGLVDAADYAVWRDTLGQTGHSLAADGDGNHAVDAADYDVWRSHFGQSAAAGVSIAAIVPEPATISHVAFALIGLFSGVSRRGVRPHRANCPPRVQRLT